MTLKELLVTFNEKEISIMINKDGVRIKSLTEDLTMHELQCASAISFVYLENEIYKKNHTIGEIILKGFDLYTKYVTIEKERLLN